MSVTHILLAVGAAAATPIAVGMVVLGLLSKVR